MIDVGGEGGGGGRGVCEGGVDAGEEIAPAEVVEDLPGDAEAEEVDLVFGEGAGVDGADDAGEFPRVGADVFFDEAAEGGGGGIDYEICRLRS